MKRPMFSLLLVAVAAFALVGGPATAEDSAEGAEVPAGQGYFEQYKCNLCHSVPSVGIEAKTKSEKMKGPDVLAGEWEKELLFKYIKQEAKVEEKEHKKGFKGTDEELQVLVDWLLEQKAEG